MVITNKEKIKEYNRKYYQKNKRKINARRKKKRDSSPEYRAYLAAKALCAHYEKRKKEGFVVKQVGVPRGSKNTPRLGFVNGRFAILYGLGIVQRITGRHNHTIYSWVRQGILPATYDNHGRVWFEEHIVDKLEKAVNEIKDTYPGTTAYFRTKYLLELLEETFDGEVQEVFDRE
jgi:hypothetical protein